MPPKKWTLTDVRRAATKHGATLDLGDRYCNADQPAGKVWAATFTHALAFERADWSYEDVVEQMARGTTACDNEPCDHCEGL